MPAETAFRFIANLFAFIRLFCEDIPDNLALIQIFHSLPGFHLQTILF